MPTIARELDGASLYAMAFTATLASGIVSIVWSGNLADRRGPRPPLLLGLVLFATGLVVAGLAPSMGVLVAARVVQGLGAGHDEHRALRPRDPRLPAAPAHGDPRRLLGGLGRAVDRRARSWPASSPRRSAGAGSSGWPSSSSSSPPCCSAASSPDCGRTSSTCRGGGGRSPRRSCSPSPCSVSTRSPTGSTPSGITLAVIALVVVGLTLLPLTPRGTLRAARGLPTDVALRALAFAAFSGAEVYLPRLLTERDGLSPSLAGVALTVTGVTWFVGSWVQGRWDRRFEIGRTAAVSLAAITLALLGARRCRGTRRTHVGRHRALPRRRPRDRHALPTRHGPGALARPGPPSRASSARPCRSATRRAPRPRSPSRPSSSPGPAPPSRARMPPSSPSWPSPPCSAGSSPTASADDSALSELSELSERSECGAVELSERSDWWTSSSRGRSRIRCVPLSHVRTATGGRAAGQRM